MKKISVILIMLVILLLSACSKTAEETKNTNKLYDLSYEISGYENVKIVTEKEKYTAEDKVIRYTITNVSEEESWINSSDDCFTLHKKVDGEWKWVGTKVEHMWTDMALCLPAGASETREIKLDDYFYLPLESGEYRIAVENLVSNTFEIVK